VTVTALLDFFRRGDVARDIRLLAARGALAPAAHEQLGLLMLLVGDADPEVADAAEATLRAIPRDLLAAFLSRSDVTAETRAFFAARGVEPSGSPPADASAPLVERGSDAPDEPGEAPPADEQSALERIAAMSVPQRVALAMKGSREERAILIRDPNKLVAVAVISSPKLTDSEVEGIARMANVSDEILRIIARTRAWTKNYAVVAALARNPKTPLPISMNLLPRLSDRDLRALSTDRNVPDVLRVTARKKLVIGQ
jgi:hypothetical protein